MKPVLSFLGIKGQETEIVTSRVDRTAYEVHEQTQPVPTGAKDTKRLSEINLDDLIKTDQNLNPSK